MKSDKDSIFVNYMLTLSSANFYSLVTHYLGNTLQSKNKHQIIEKLILFLQSEVTLSHINEYLEAHDLMLLATIDLWTLMPTETYVRTILPIEKSQLQNYLERFLIIRHEHKFILNPILKDFFHKEHISYQLLFQTQPSTTHESEFWMTDRIIMLSMSLFIHEKENKKIKGLWAKVFPNLSMKFEEILHTAYKRLELVDENWEPIIQNLQDFAKLNQCMRIAYILAAYACEDATQISLLSQTVYCVLERISGQIVFSEILSYTHILLNQVQLDPSMIERLKDCELFENVHLNQEHMLIKKIRPVDTHPFLIIESDHSAVLMEYPIFLTSIVLAFKPAFSDIVAHLSTDQSICASAFGAGYTPESLLYELTPYARTPIPDSFASSIKHFQVKYKRIRLYSGHILHLDPDMEKRLSPFLTQVESLQKIAEGFYLFHEYPCPEIQKVFKTIGLNFPTAQSAHRHSTALLVKELTLSSLGDNSLPHTAKKANFEKKIALKKLATNAQQEIRIDQGLILDKEQLFYHQSPERQTTHVVDFNHKINIVQQAIHDKLYLEISLEVESKTRSIIVSPSKIEKENNKPVLVGFNYKTKKPVRVHIAHLVSILTIRPTLMQVN